MCKYFGAASVAVECKGRGKAKKMVCLVSDAESRSRFLVSATQRGSLVARAAEARFCGRALDRWSFTADRPMGYRDRHLGGRCFQRPEKFPAISKFGAEMDARVRSAIEGRRRVHAFAPRVCEPSAVA